MPEIPGLIKGLGVTFRTMLKPAVTTQYPHVKEAPPTRARARWPSYSALAAFGISERGRGDRNI